MQFNLRKKLRSRRGNFTIFATLQLHYPRAAATSLPSRREVLSPIVLFSVHLKVRFVNGWFLHDLEFSTLNPRVQHGGKHGAIPPKSFEMPWCVETEAARQLKQSLLATVIPPTTVTEVAVLRQRIGNDSLLMAAFSRKSDCCKYELKLKNIENLIGVCS